MDQPRQTALLALMAALLLPGCAQNGGYPSLAPRPIELTGDVTPPAANATPEPADPAMVERIAELTNRTADAARQFDAAAESARGAVAAAKGAQPGSRPWLAAQTALAVLDDRIAVTRGVAGAIDVAIIDQADRGKPVPDPLTAAASAAAREVARQADVIATLSASIAAP